MEHLQYVVIKNLNNHKLMKRKRSKKLKAKLRKCTAQNSMIKWNKLQTHAHNNNTIQGKGLQLYITAIKMPNFRRMVLNITQHVYIWAVNFCDIRNFVSSHYTYSIKICNDPSKHFGHHIEGYYPQKHIWVNQYAISVLITHS